MEIDFPRWIMGYLFWLIIHGNGYLYNSPTFWDWRYIKSYYAIDDLDPKDYSLDKKRAERIEPEEAGSVGLDNELNGPDFVDFSDILSHDEESYDDIEIEDEPFR